MSEVSTPIRLVLMGWLSVLLYAIAVLYDRGSDELGSMVVFATVAIAMGLWVWKRQSRASLITSLFIGLLHTLEQLGYSMAAATDDPFEAYVFVVDVLGFAGALLIVAGATAELVKRRRTNPAISANAA